MKTADRVFTNAAVHTLADPDADGTPDAEAVAVRDGRIVRVDSAHECEFLADVETDVIDCGGRHLLPGFIDAHTHMEHLGATLRATALGTDDRATAIDRLVAAADDGDGPIRGHGYDESRWADDRYLTRSELDAVSETRPVVAFRVDMHAASVNSVAIERYAIPDDALVVADGDPTGVVREATDVLTEATRPDSEGVRERLLAARDRAHECGVTGVHDMVATSVVPRLYRELAAAGDLDLRVRINYWRGFLDPAREVGLVTDRDPSGLVSVGAIKSVSDGSIGARTARIAEPYADDPGERGEWVVDPATLRSLVADAEAAGFDAAIHAIGDRAVTESLVAVAGPDEGSIGDDADDTTDGGNDFRHRIEHAELADEAAIRRLAAGDAVASVQPNFLRWADEGGLYDCRLGETRRRESNRFGRLHEAGARLAFGSDCMPFGPLRGLAAVVDAPTEDQRLSVTDALRAYTVGSAYAGRDEDRLGTVETGTRADLVVLDESPWTAPSIAEIDVAVTVVDGNVVYDDR
ncbi:amidohydrolase [Halobacteriales archaeon SW_7_68_16]|nr:MAG: amidohydrolase [Halobacteriales archaeon SW_7_68_16]